MTSLTPPFLSVAALHKAFVLHGQGGMTLEVMRDLSLTLSPGECLVLAGPSGIGKSTLLKMLHGSYRVTGGTLRLHFEDGDLSLDTLPAHAWHTLRRDVIGYVSQFLRVIPRVKCLKVVMEPALARGMDADQAQERAEDLLRRLGIPERLWSLAPGTFSGGEQQRVNIARSFMVHWPVLLLDEPTASLDEANRRVVISLIEEARRAGSAVIAISHDPATRDAIADRYLDMQPKELSHAC